MSRDALARVIAEALGYDWSTLYANKHEWIADRGSRHDLNTPYTDEFRTAADAVIAYVEKNTGGHPKCHT